MLSRNITEFNNWSLWQNPRYLVNLYKLVDMSQRQTGSSSVRQLEAIKKVLELSKTFSRLFSISDITDL